MVSPVIGNPASSSPPRTAACTEPPAPPSQETTASPSLRSSASSPQASFSTAARCSRAHSAARWNSSSMCAQRSGVKWHLRVLHFLVKPGFPHAQVAPDGNRRNAQRLGYFIHGESAEIAEFDGFAFSRVDLLKGAEASVEGNEFSTALGLKTNGLVQWHFDSVALAGLLAAGVVHQDLAHQARSHTKEMRAALPGGIGLIDEPHIGFMDKRGRLPHGALAFFAQGASGKVA